MSVVGMSYIGALLDLLDGALVERASIAVEAILAVIGALDTLLGALVQATLVDIANPAEMALEICSSDIRLESNDVLARDDLARVNLSSRSSVDESEEGSRSDGEVLEVHHCEEVSKRQIQEKRQRRL
jgi:hypothetical protein